jgi:hypothetical protein
LPTSPPPTKLDINCHKYEERPLIGQITTTDDNERTATIDWLIGTYTGTWRVWNGREGKLSVIMTNEIAYSDIITTVTFTPAISRNLYITYQRLAIIYKFLLTYGGSVHIYICPWLAKG